MFNRFFILNFALVVGSIVPIFGQRSTNSYFRGKYSSHESPCFRNYEQRYSVFVCLDAHRYVQCYGLDLQATRDVPHGTYCQCSDFTTSVPYGTYYSPAVCEKTGAGHLKGNSRKKVVYSSSDHAMDKKNVRDAKFEDNEETKPGRKNHLGKNDHSKGDGGAEKKEVKKDNSHDNKGQHSSNLPRELIRVAEAQYNEGDTAERGATNPNPRVISNSVCQGERGASIPNARGLSNFVWAWGQLIDHEIGLTPPQSGADAERLDIQTEPLADPNEPFDDVVRTIPFTRSEFTRDAQRVRQQPNELTAVIDGSVVYGISDERMRALRAFDGSGKLKTTAAANGEVLAPFNTEGLENDMPPGTDPENFFLAGDVRANENIVLISMHTLMVREHNFQCDELAAAIPHLTGDEIYKRARKYVTGFIQHITYTEFLPALLGSFAPYSGFDPSVSPDIANEFSTVGFRIGHTMLSSELQIGTDPSEFVLLLDAFFRPQYVVTNGIDRILQGNTMSASQEVDNIVVEDVRSFLFGPPTSTMLEDLAARNIQRGRDHGIPGYNALREAYGLSSISDFSELPMEESIRLRLSNLYESVNDIDPWVGAIAEDNLPGASVGPLMKAILTEQFSRIRAGDKNWFENDASLSYAEKVRIENTSIADILRRNTAEGVTFIDDVFRVPSSGGDNETSNSVTDPSVSNFKGKVKVGGNRETTHLYKCWYTSTMIA